MLPLLAFGTIGRFQNLETPSALAARLGTAGYAFTATGGEGRWGTIAYRETKVDVRLEGSREGPGSSPWIGLKIELGFPKEVPDARSPLVFDDPARPMGTTFTSHLGRTVTAAKWIEVAPGSSPEKLRAEVDEFGNSSKAFARAHGGRFEPAPEVDWSKRSLADDLVLEWADPVSLERLIGAWGWRYRGPYGFSGVPRWAIPVQLGEARMWLTEVRDDSRHDDQIAIARFGPDALAQTITLGKGIKVGDLKRRLEEIAHPTEKP